MEAMNRKPFQGIWNIIRFNWHFYVIALLLLAAGVCFRQYFPVLLLLWLLIVSLLLSLTVSWYIYDASGLYDLQWLDIPENGARLLMVNINAGFDETSHLLAGKYPDARWKVFDFYDPEKHTEVSIRRARKAYAAYPGTQQMRTDGIPLDTASADVIFLLLAAHEIRDHGERSGFFTELARGLHEQGKIIVLEHLRDTRNFIAYNIGFLHFFSREQWQQTFEASGLRVTAEQKITPFLSAFILQKNGTAY
ncbi:methyltransferase [Chitinophaga sp. 212800010-3]|uniref:methyltransferase n=1 Tax=unclassified Chitinophaga TaxID=2619133 RepID=UPI002DE65379|nr:Methyltransferase [Chitinophaga sp. 212800010-3]